MDPVGRLSFPPGPFDVRHGSDHGTIQLSSDLILVTGGDYAEDLVTSYQLTGDGDETSLTSLNHGRSVHACGVYQDAGGQQVRRLWSRSIFKSGKCIKQMSIPPF